MKPLISVIIPIYGVEKYLNRAVDSVLAQTYRNLEIILVDDGSKDGCGQICDAYEKKEARIRVIHKENGGLSDARNAGLDVAGGDYIAFLDSDDYYAPRFIEILYEEIIKNDAQVAICTYEVTEEMKIQDGPDFEAYGKQYDEGQVIINCYGREAMLMNQYDICFSDATYFIVAWNKLYKAALWREIRFPKGKIHEDEATTYRIFDQAQKGVYVKLPLYAYFSMPGSITRETFHLKRLDWMDALDDRIQYFETHHELALKKLAIRARADGAIRYYLPLSQTIKEAKQEKKRLRGYVKQALTENKNKDPERGNFLGVKTKLGYRLFLLLPGIYVRVLYH